MKFKDYCIIVLGLTEGAKLEIRKVSQTAPNFLDAKGVVIATFTSILTTQELTEYFKSLERNFMVFDLDVNSSGVNFTKEETHEALFGHLKTNANFALEEMTNNLIDEIRKTSGFKPINTSGETPSLDVRLEEKNVKPKVRKRDVNLTELTIDEASIMFDEIIDKGVDNLTDDDKELLGKLTKKIEKK